MIVVKGRIMRRISVSVLAMFLALPASAGTRLPVVNLAAGSVSARAAFGEEITPKEPVAKADATRVAEAPKKTEKKVATRAAKKATAPAAKAATKSAATGGEIFARDDVLTPRRPSADLWAKSDNALRIPTPDEFSVFKSEAELPEESIDTPLFASQTPVQSAGNTFVAPRAGELDAQIERLVELQRRADESVRTAPRVVTRAAESASVARQTNEKIAAADIAPAKNATTHDNATAQSGVSTGGARLTRMVVPMAPDVVVRTVEKNTSPRIAAARDDMSSMSPTELRKAFRKTFLSENKHLSTFQIDDRFDVASDMTSSVEGFTARRDLSESAGIRPLEIKIRFRDDDAALSRDNYNLLSEYASIVVSNPKRAIQVSIPQAAARSGDARKLAARRLAIVEQVLRDTGVSEQRIMPVLSQRDEDGFVLRIISSDQYETLTQKRRDMFGDTVGKKTYKSMSW